MVEPIPRVSAVAPGLAKHCVPVHVVYVPSAPIVADRGGVLV